jgi:hypothetical protein
LGCQFGWQLSVDRRSDKFRFVGGGGHVPDHQPDFDVGLMPKKGLK